MSLILDGTTGLSDVDGTAAAPALRGTDTNTGIFFPAADTIAFAEGGAEAMRINSSGQLLVGTSTAPASNAVREVLTGGTANYLQFTSTTNDGFILGNTAGNGSFFTFTGAQGSETYTERMRIDSSGNLLVGSTTQPNAGKLAVSFTQASNQGICLQNTSASNSASYVLMINSAGGIAGTIAQTGATTVNYGSGSDYRLKNNVLPMVGALEKVAQLKPCTYNWIADDSAGQGFIAHELQAVVPDCVVGEKDAVNEDGSIKMQMVDTSFLVATLTAAIQEQQALITALTTRITALEGAA